MTIEEVYENYKHLDDVFMDMDDEDNFESHIIKSLWVAIKKSVKED